MLMSNPYDTLLALFSQLFSSELRKLLEVYVFWFAKLDFSCILNSELCMCQGVLVHVQIRI